MRQVVGRWKVKKNESKNKKKGRSAGLNLIPGWNP
jgi:hypothetical protein